MSSIAYSQTNADLGVAAIGLVVSDINVSEIFYRNILGMEETGEFTLDEQWSREAGAANGQPFSVKQFKLKDVSTATVLKLAYFEKTERASTTSGLSAVSGVNYITLFYSEEGFSDVMERIEKAGIEKIGWVKRETYQLVFIRDPDGVFIEIVGPSIN